MRGSLEHEGQILILRYFVTPDGKQELDRQAGLALSIDDARRQVLEAGRTSRDAISIIQVLIESWA
jgi:hypothetical protein